VASDTDFVYVKMSVMREKDKTPLGDIFLELNKGKAPITVANFLNYVDKKFYDGTVFHRVIDRFMIQGGGFDRDLKEKGPTDKPIKNEWNNGLKNQVGTVAMARTSVPDSATAQFFINVAPNQFLDTPRPPDTAAYCVFGRVIGGMDVVDKIKTSKVAAKGIHEAVPVDAILISSVTRVSKEEAMKAADKK
jgi:peptidyl-prolyl cis-trans isomerase B (cyclophilin B)